MSSLYLCEMDLKPPRSTTQQYIGLSTLSLVASDLLNDALRLDNELSTCQWPRWQQRPVGYTFPYKMANFHGAYLKLGRIDSTDFHIWYNEKCFSYCYKISKWYEEPVLCYRQVKICNEQTRTQWLFSPACASTTCGSARICRRKNRELLGRGSLVMWFALTKGQ